MDQNAALAARIREWMLQVMEDSGLTVSSWAQKAEVARTTIARPVKEGYQFVTSSRTLAKLATAAGVSPPDFMTTQERQFVPAFLPVRYKVQAGLWMEREAFVDDYVAPEKPVAPDPAFGEWPQWLELVVGDSVDRQIPPGGYAHVVDAIEMGYAPHADDFVVVERKRAGGQLCERTIKQIAFGRSGAVELWPRSHNPSWQTPVILNGGADGDESVEVAIVGLVIGFYASLRR